MWHLHCSDGVGDTYLVCALWREFEKVNGPTTISVREEHVHIPQMFGARFQTLRSLMMVPGEHAWRPGIPINAGPLHAARGDAIEKLTAGGAFSRADLFRFILRLPWDAPLAKPLLLNEWRKQAASWTEIRPAFQHKGKSVVIMPHAKNMPAPPLEFWMQLAVELAGKRNVPVLFNDLHTHLPSAGDTRIEMEALEKSGRILRIHPTLGVLYAMIEHAGWVIGATSGAFHAAAAAELEARKSLVAMWPLGFDKPFRVNDWLALESPFPYSNARSFCGPDLRVDQFEVDTSIRSWTEAIEQIAGIRALSGR